MTKVLREWLKAAQPKEELKLAKLVDTSSAYLHQLANEHRTASADIAGKIEQATFEIRDERTSAEGRALLPVVYRGELVPACAICPYFKRGLDNGK